MKRFLLPVFLLTAKLVSGLTVDSGIALVIPDKPTVQEKYAAGQMQHYLSRVIGKNFVLVPEKDHKGGAALYIGSTRRAAQQKFPAFKVEEYRIKAAGKDVIITGSLERGVLFAVYEFLEKFANVRFFAPGCEYVTRKKVLTIPDDTDIFYKPLIQYRYVYGGLANRPETFARKLRMTGWGPLAHLGGSERYGFAGHGHSLGIYSGDFPLEISWVSSGGTRKIVKKNDIGAICYSDPEVMKRFVKKLKAGIAADRKEAAKRGVPPPRFYSITQNDGEAACFCKKCHAFSRKHGVSGLLIDFLNRLYDNVKGEYPYINLVTLAYFDSLDAPRGVVPNSHVVVRISTYTRGFHDHLRPISSPANVEYRKILNDWQKCASGRLGVWDYWRYWNGLIPPATCALALQDICRKYRDMGMRVVFVEYENELDCLLSFYDLTYYLGARLLNDPDMDVPRAVKEFTDFYYGKAGVYMRRYLDLIHEGMNRDEKPMEQAPIKSRKYLADPEFYRQGFDLLEKARKAVGSNKKLRARVDIEMVILQAAYLKTWEAHRNTLKLERKKIQQDIIATLPGVLKEFFSPGALKTKSLGELVAFYADTVVYKPVKAPRNVKPLKNFNTKAPGIRLFEYDKVYGHGMKISDPDSPSGWTKSHSAVMPPEEVAKTHKKGFIFGLYSSAVQKHLMISGISRKNMAQDEKYHWYYMGRTVLYPKLLLFMHHTWTLSVVLNRYIDPGDPAREYDMYAFLKFQGPDYVKGSKSPGDVRIARFALIPVKNAEKSK